LSENDVADTVVRLGGDEFIILLNEIIHVHDAAKIARRIVKELSLPFILSGREIVITTSIGISIYPSDGTDVESLLKHADIAMYQAKKQGRNNYQYYEKSMNADALQKLSLEGNLRNALQKGEFLLHYQPILDAKSRNVRGVEALLRWASPEMGSVAPAEFIPLAEETGLIVPIGDRVLQTACLQTKEWKRAGFESLNISVNLSLRQFENPALLKTISAALRDAELRPENLELEITESTVMNNPEKAVAIMREIRHMGVLISVDDFGTGYSSLNYLRQLPLNALKIDRSFISNALASSSDASIISAIIILAHKLHLKVIAEGAETEDEFNFLCSEECDEVQGYLFSRPLPEDEFARYLKGIKEF
jgi:predicted signal transduction protein with EAL and GGDEF domain